MHPRSSYICTNFSEASFYATAFTGWAGITVGQLGGGMGGESCPGLYFRNLEVQKVHTWWGPWFGGVIV